MSNVKPAKQVENLLREFREGKDEDLVEVIDKAIAAIQEPKHVRALDGHDEAAAAKRLYTCRDCKFWDPYGDDPQMDTARGICRALPPTRHAPDGDGLWPNTEARDWCAALEAKR